jgi:copper transport protein
VPLTGSAAGTYTVIWTVVAADTHPSRGEFTFNVGHPSPVRAPGLGTGDVGQVPPIGLAMQALSRWLHFAGFALSFGVAIYSLFLARDPPHLLGRSQPGEGRPLLLAGAGVALLLAAEPLALLAQTISLDPSHAFDGDALTSALTSPFGHVLGLRVGAALLFWAVLGGLKQAPWLRWSVPALAVALSLVDAMTAHAVPALPQPMGLALNAVHIFAMVTWVGGLAAFALAPAAMFGRVAAWSAAMLILSGAALALLHFGQWQELMTTAYGQSLIVKIPLVASALLLARLGRRRWELVTLAAVLGVSAVLLSLPQPR